MLRRHVHGLVTDDDAGSWPNVRDKYKKNVILGLSELEVLAVLSALVMTVGITYLVSFSYDELVAADQRMIAKHSFESATKHERSSHSGDGPIEIKNTGLPFYHLHYGKENPVSGGLAFYGAGSVLLATLSLLLTTGARIFAPAVPGLRRAPDAANLLIQVLNPLIVVGIVALFICTLRLFQ
jgi:hypothetical protein